MCSSDLEKQPRRSGFLTPNIGNSSRRGKMVGVGYFWAINRSTDLTYRMQYFSERGLAHQADFRAKLNDKTDLDANIYAVADRGQNGGQSAGGYLATVNTKSDLGRGWTARGELNYLSSFAFRQQFTESFHEAIFSETHSAGSLAKHWNTYGLTVVAQRDVSFQSTAEGDQIQIGRAHV